ncbi:MAG: nitroreductase family protein [Burkholderiaceae bacterium]
MADRTMVEQILDLARWAPSGDNTQPWRFQIVDDAHVVVYGFDTRNHCVYDLDGHPSQISIGALLETISIAATAHRLLASITRRPDARDETPTFDVRFGADADVRSDPLIAQIPLRSVQRRPMRTRPLTPSEKQALEASVGTSHRVLWLEGAATRLRTARLMFENAKLRLTMPEAYRVHRDIIHWGVRHSEDRVPDQALGVDPMTARLMRWIMRDWQRVEFFNRYLAGTVAPRIQMDLLPGLLCAAHFVLLANRRPEGIDDYVAGGRAVQRFWLTAAGLGLVLQPELTPLIFGRYAREGRPFSETPGMLEQALKLSRKLDALIGSTESQHAVFIGRIGAGSTPTSRSTRRPLEDLLVSAPP